MDADYVRPWITILKKRLGPACQKVEIAGSLRRGKRDVHDAELVLVPKWDTGLFGEATDSCGDLSALIERMERDGHLKRDMAVERQGPRLKRFLVPTLRDLVLELYIADERNFGNILAIRTGDKDFSALVMACRDKGGKIMPWGMRQDAGYLWMDGEDESKTLVPCPTEEEFFAAINFPCLRPYERTGEAARRLGGSR